MESMLIRYKELQKEIAYAKTGAWDNDYEENSYEYCDLVKTKEAQIQELVECAKYMKEFLKIQKEELIKMFGASDILFGNITVARQLNNQIAELDEILKDTDSESKNEKKNNPKT